MLSDVATVVADAVAKVSSSKTADPEMPVFITGLAVVSVPPTDASALIVTFPDKTEVVTMSKSFPCSCPDATTLPVADPTVNLFVFTEKSPAIFDPKVVSSDPVTVKAVPDSETIESDIVEPVAHLVSVPVVPVPCTPV